MVKEWGMSDKAGLRTFESSESQQQIIVQEFSHQTIDHIDTEIQRLLQVKFFMRRLKLLCRTYILSSFIIVIHNFFFCHNMTYD